MEAPDLVWITPATGGKPAQLTILKGGELETISLELKTMTKLLSQLAMEIRNAAE